MASGTHSMVFATGEPACAVGKKFCELLLGRDAFGNQHQLGQMTVTAAANGHPAGRPRSLSALCQLPDSPRQSGGFHPCADS